MLSEKIRTERIKKGLSQAQLAKIIGVSQQAVAKWEIGKAYPDIGMLSRLADLFDVSLDFLAGRSDTRQPDIVRHSDKFADLPEEDRMLLDTVADELRRRRQKGNEGTAKKETTATTEIAAGE